MKKQIGILIPLLAIGVVLSLGYKGFGWDSSFKESEIASFISPLSDNVALKLEAWTVFENYLKFVHSHDLAGVKSLSYQTSETCNDPARETECFALMDNLYSVASFLELGTFTGIESDDRQIILYSDGPTVTSLYFVRDENGSPKVLGLKFCLEDETNKGSCIDTNPETRDKDGNGWWDSVESVFYK